MHHFVTLARFQLKYCERCGALWLRRDGVDCAYCPACEQFMAELPLCRPPRKTAHAVATPAVLALLPALVEFSQFVAGCAA